MTTAASDALEMVTYSSGDTVKGGEGGGGGGGNGGGGGD